jgi:hypothetical protein
MLKYKLLHIAHFHAQWLLVVMLSVMSLLNLFSQVEAADLINRRITVGTSQASTLTTHTFGFGITTSAAVGSIEFEYCDNSPIVGSPCSVPIGLNVNAATITSQTGETGFAVHPATNGNRILLSRAPSATTPQTVSYRFANVMNPSDAQQTVFVRVSTYASNDGSGLRGDAGAVVFSTARNLTTTGYVPPYLTFCVGLTVAANCSTTEGNFIDFGELLRTNAATGTSQFAGATNDVTGYSVAVYGNTLTSGNNVIPPLASGGASVVGTSQYGLNLRQNSAPSVGQNPGGIGTTTVQPGYGTPNNFRFVPGETIASSPLPTNFNKFTVSYLINVSAAQKPGVYAATMTYIATASF